MKSNLPTVSLNTDTKSPYYFASFYGADGKQKRRSTKVPHAGGMYQGRRISAAQAKTPAPPLHPFSPTTKLSPTKTPPPDPIR